MTRKFRLVDQGQKIYIQALNPLSSWKALDEDVNIQADGKKNYKISF